jgi:hypothetical protein
MNERGGGKDREGGIRERRIKIFKKYIEWRETERGRERVQKTCEKECG